MNVCEKGAMICSEWSILINDDEIDIIVVAVSE